MQTAWQCTPKEKERGEWLQFPFIVGCSFASADITCLLEEKSKLGITHQHLIDAPSAADRSFNMWTTHGKQGEVKWCRWQEAWLAGLKQLPVGSNVFVVPSSKEHNTKVFYKLPEGTKFFKEKLEDVTAFDSQLKRDTVCFDPSYELPAGEAATILQWERCQIQLAAQERDYKLVHVYSEKCSGGGNAPNVDWYGLAFQKKFECYDGVFSDL